MKKNWLSQAKFLFRQKFDFSNLFLIGKGIYRTFLLVIFLWVAILPLHRVFGQGAITATWALTSDQSVALGGAAASTITANAQTLTGLVVATSSGYGSNGQRTAPNSSGGGWPAESGANAGRYALYTLSPAAGFNLSVTQIKLDVSNEGTSGNGVNIAYSTDGTNYSNVTVDFAMTNSSTPATKTYTTSPLPISVSNGNTIYLKISPWTTAANASGKYLKSRNVIISGTTTSANVPPTVTTNTASSITNSSASSGGNVASSISAVTDRGVVFGTSAFPTSNPTSNGTGTGSFTSAINGLVANTKYYYRAYATNSYGTGYGTEYNFTTLPNAPTIAAGTAINASGFTANWTAPSGGTESFTYTLEVDDDFGFGSPNATYPGLSSAGLSKLVSGLAGNTTYYYRVKAVNATGSSDWSSSENITTLVSSSPTILVSPNTLSFGDVNVGASAELSFDLSAANLSPASGNITVTAPAGYMVSTSSGTGYASSINVPYTGAVLNSITIYVIFQPSASGSFTGNLTNAGGGATTQNVSVSGNGLAVSAGALLEQQFNGGDAGSKSNAAFTDNDYISGGSPGGTKFNYIASGHSSAVVYLNGGASGTLSTTESSSSSIWAAVRSTAFSPLPTSLIISFDANIETGSSGSNPKGFFYVGNSFTNTVTTEANANVHSSFSWRYGSSGTFYLRAADGTESTGITDGSNYRVFFVINNSGATLYYKAPDGTEASIANDKYDLWLGTTLLFDEKAAVTGTQSLSQIKFGDLATSSAGRGNMSVDNILVAPIPGTPVSTTESAVSYTSFTANWNAVSGVSGYRLDVSTQPDFSSFVSGYEALNVGNVTNYSVTGLLNGTQYYYRVRAYNSYTVATYTSGNSNVQDPITLVLPPDIVLSSANPAVAVADIGQGAAKVPIYRFTLVAGNAGAITINQLNFTTGGTYSGTSDITNFKLWYAPADDITAATQIGASITTTTAGARSFTGLSQKIPTGTTGYFWITADVAAGATAGRTIYVSPAVATTDITVSLQNTFTGTAYAGGTQTVAASIYYNIPGTDISNLNNWGTNTNGSGAHPSSFTGNGITYNVFNTGASISNNWTIGGTGSKLVLGDGATATNLTIPAAYTFSGTIDVSNNASLNIQNTATSSITLGVLGCSGVGSTVNYSGSGVLVRPANYCNLGIDNAANFPASGIVAVAKVFTPGSVTVATPGSSLQFNGSVAQNVPTNFTYYRLGIINSSGIATATVSNGSSPHKVFVSDSLQVIQDFSITAGHWLTLNAGSKWKISSGKKLTIANGAILDQQTKNSPSLPSYTDSTCIRVDGEHWMNSSQITTNYGGESDNTNDAGNDGMKGTYSSTSFIKVYQGVPRIPRYVWGNVLWTTPGTAGEETFLPRNNGIHIIGGSLYVEEGKINIGSGSISRTLFVNGNVEVAAGELHAYGGGANSQRMVIMGDVTVSGGSLYAGDYSYTSGYDYEDSPTKIIEFRKNLLHVGGKIGNGLDTVNQSPSAGYKVFKGGEFIFNGAAEQTIQTLGFDKSVTAAAPSIERFITVTINNANNVRLTGSGSLFDPDSLYMQNGHIIAENGTLVFPDTMINANQDRFIVTLGTGALKHYNVGGSNAATGYRYHVGTALTSYNPVVLHNDGTIDNFTVNAITPPSSTPTYDYSPAGQPFNPTKLVNVVYGIAEQTAGGSDLRMDLQWNNGGGYFSTNNEASSFVRTASLVIGHWYGGAWAEYPAMAGPPAGTVSGSYYTYRAGFNSFSPFMVGNCGAFIMNSCSILPLSQLDFSGKETNGLVKLEWKAFRESAIAAYEVERSTDSRDFTSIGKVLARNGNADNAYNLHDEKAPSGILFYRLRIVEQDGKYSYSKVISINRAKVPHLQLQPNPVKDRLTVLIPNANQEARITVYGVTGQQLMQLKTGIGTSTVSINTSFLQPGVYLLQYQNGNEIQMERFVKQ